MIRIWSAAVFLLFNKNDKGMIVPIQMGFIVVKFREESHNIQFYCVPEILKEGRSKAIRTQALISWDLFERFENFLLREWRDQRGKLHCDWIDFIKVNKVLGGKVFP
jgi:hypothetical protein